VKNRILFLASCAAAMVAGCGPNTAKISQESSNLKPLGVLYGQFTGQHRGQAPANEAEFKTFVKATDPSFLKSFNVTDAESLFISTRDNKPFIVLYGAPSGPAGPGGQPVIAYEAEGHGGKRYVVSFMGAVEEVDAKRFQELVPSAK